MHGVLQLISSLHESRQVLRRDSYGKNIVWEKGPYFIAVDDPEDATYVTLWYKNKKVGFVSTRSLPGESDRLGIGTVNVEKLHRRQGLATQMYRILLKYMNPSKRGVVSYGPDVASHHVPKIHRRLGARLVGDMSYIDKVQESKWKDELPGGLADKKKPEDFDQDQLKRGIKVELEHTGSRKLATEIAMDHLTEDPHYYTKLARVHHESLGRQLAGVSEKMIQPDENQIEAIMNVLRPAAEMGWSLEDINAQLEPLGAQVDYGPDEILRKEASGAAAMVDSHGVVHITPESLHNLHALKSIILPHELVHTGQIQRMGDKADQVYRQASAQVLRNGGIDLDAYLRQPQEMMAIARTTVDLMRNRGMTGQQIVSDLKNGRGLTGLAYSYSQMPPEIKNKFLRYASEYANAAR